jgi:hypothetical protein
MAAQHAQLRDERERIREVEIQRAQKSSVTSEHVNAGLPIGHEDLVGSKSQ